MGIKRLRWNPTLIVIAILLFVSSCNQNANGIIHSWEADDLRPMRSTEIPLMDEIVRELPTEPMDESSSMPSDWDIESSPVGTETQVWMEPYLPYSFTQGIILSSGVGFTDKKSEADYFLTSTGSCTSGTEWVYVMVTPFSSLLQGISSQDLQTWWVEGDITEIGGHPIFLDKKTKDVFTSIWGASAQSSVVEYPSDELLEAAWTIGDVFAIIPFEELSPKWTVISIDSISPLDLNFDRSTYALTARFCFTNVDGTEISTELLTDSMPITNRDESKFTSVLLTGVTALVRATAHKMETKGILYPGERISELIRSSDFTHVSNEVAFASDCPFPNPIQADLRFCSSPAYIELLDYLDIDIIELTGNHIQDWSTDAFIQTLGIYEQYGMLYYAGGLNEEEARQPLLIEHNGNKLAFLGCNAVGPPGAWASNTRSGNANCGNYEWIKEAITNLVDQGYLPIVTLQHNEFYSLQKTSPQIRDFDPLAALGAVVVSGSQAHYPNAFNFVGDHFVHYGLGNLFFDQMDQYIAPGIQREFVDRHIFYDGEYINTEIYTLYLEDFAQPRFMTSEERTLFLDEAFRASGWRIGK